jgi:hypothetical protein
MGEQRCGALRFAAYHHLEQQQPAAKQSSFSSNEWR